MGAKTVIEWTDATWNPIGGCSIKSPGCKHCYAQKLAGTRLKHHPLYAGTTTLTKDGKPVFNGTMTSAPFDAAVWEWPLHWRGSKQPVRAPRIVCTTCGKPCYLNHYTCDREVDGMRCAACFAKTPCGQDKHGEECPTAVWGSPARPLCFAFDMSDVFHESRHINIQRRAFAVMALAKQVDFQVLTKRADIMAQFIGDPDEREQIEIFMNEIAPAHWHDREIDAWPLPNIWTGFSAERQCEFDERWEPMKRLAAAGWVIFVSIEPMLEGVTLPPDFLALGRHAQVICGGLSGADESPLHPDWPRALRDQCNAAGVPFFFKQWGEWTEVDGPRCQAIDQSPGTKFWMQPDGKLTEEAEGRRRFSVWTTSLMRRVGKKAAGRLLDGREWSEFPT